MRIPRITVLGMCLLLTLGACSSKQETSLDDVRAMYTGWCAYKLEVGEIRNTLEGCVQDTWNAGQNGEMSKPLHESFATTKEMNDYIAFESAIRLYCEMVKKSPTDYEQLLGVTRVGELTYENCKDQLIQLNLISTILREVPYDPNRSQGWTYEPGVTYRIDGDVYNDPFGLDYKNGPSDEFGDGR